MWILIPLGLIVWWRYSVHKHNTGDLTPERQAAYTLAMTFARDPGKLSVLAQAFDDTGLHEQARALRKRAGLSGLPKHTKEMRQKAFKMAFSSTDSKTVLELAAVFEAEGMGSAAQMLKDYASGLEQSLAIPPVILQVPPETHPNDQLQHPESQAPNTQAGAHMEAPVPPEATSGPVPPVPPAVTTPAGPPGAVVEIQPHGDGFQDPTLLANNDPGYQDG
jgi:hypothetical protein